MNLRSSCTALHTNQAILSSVKSVCRGFITPSGLPAEGRAGWPLPGPTDILFLSKLPCLQQLAFTGTTSVFHVQRLQTLQHLEIGSDVALDVLPLSALPKLSRLWLDTGRPALNLQHLSGLTELMLLDTWTWDDVLQLTGLSSLALHQVPGADARSLEPLRRLSRLELRSCSSWPELLASAALQRVPPVYVLTLGAEGPCAPVDSLAAALAPCTSDCFATSWG